MSGQKRQLFEHFKTLNDSFSVISHYIFEETYILFELPFHTERNGFSPTPYIKKIVRYDHIIKYM